MGEVCRVYRWEERGHRWNPRDPDDPVQRLFVAFRRASRHGPRRGFLLSQLIFVNEPLIITLLHQLRGYVDGKTHEVRFRRGKPRMRVVGADGLDWEDALNAGRLAAAKALENFDPDLGSFAVHLKNKVYYELQCLVLHAGVVSVERGTAPPSLEYLEDDDHVGRVTAAFLRSEGEEDDAQPVELVEVPEDVRPRVHPSTPAFDARSALEVLFEDHCTFAGHARSAASSLHGRYALLARVRGESASERRLVAALRDRNVRTTRVRVAWNATPVWGFAGVSLQSVARPRSLQSAAVVPCGFHVQNE